MPVMIMADSVISLSEGATSNLARTISVRYSSRASVERYPLYYNAVPWMNSFIVG